MLDPEVVAGLDAEGVLVEAGRAQAAMMAAEAARFVLAARWVDLHAGEAEPFGKSCRSHTGFCSRLRAA